MLFLAVMAGALALPFVVGGSVQLIGRGFCRAFKADPLNAVEIGDLAVIVTAVLEFVALVALGVKYG